MTSAADSAKICKENLELYFVIQKCLSHGPLKKTFEALGKEIEKIGILPKRLDWQGNAHERTLREFELLYPHVGPDYLLKLCRDSLSDRQNGRFECKDQYSLLYNRSKNKSCAPSMNYAARRHCMPLVEPYWQTPIVHNIVNIIDGRRMSGPLTRTLLIGASRYSSLQFQRRTVGHLSSVYCLLFDRSGKYIITGADDLLIKVWSSITGRLLATFRGASSEITDIAINLENTLLAAGSIDKILRVWNLQTGAPVTVLSGHTGMITSVNFCPATRWDVRYLISTSTDGSVAFWTYCHLGNGTAQFSSKPILYQEKIRPGQAQMICSSFSPGGAFLATGSADHHVRVYFMHGDEGPHRILETPVHTDRVDSIQWSNRGLRFVSGSKDGSAHIWHFECQQWKSCQLAMSTKLSSNNRAGNSDPEEDKKLKVTMVSWDCSDTWVITAVSDFSLKVWRADTGALVKILTGHTNEIYVLESHPHDSHVFFSAGHDGQLFVWDILRGAHVAEFSNTLQGQGFGSVYDAKWSPDGTQIAATDSHGHILLFGLGSGNQLLKTLPTELFFHTDYRPLFRDANHGVLDEQTQLPPHLMPPPFLVDIDGNPYPPMLQRLVPGRENCQVEQLVPTIVVGNEGSQEVIQGLPEINPVAAGDAEPAEGSGQQPGARSARVSSIRGFRNDSIGAFQTGNLKWSQRVLVQSLKTSELERVKEVIEYLSSLELAHYKREMRRRPVMINTAATSSAASSSNNKHTGRRRKARTTAYRSEPVASEGEQDESEDAGNTSASSEVSVHQEMSSSDASTSDSSDSSGYSDWVADRGVNLEPPKRSKRRQTANKRSLVVPPTANNTQKGEEPPTKATSTKSIPNFLKLTKGELPELYKPPEWLSETMPCKAPYFPQMGDEIVYFREGHEKYIEAVKAQSVYTINPKDLPWLKTDLKETEFFKVVGIKYELRPPRLCCLKLALLDDEGQLTDTTLTIKYHDMADVLDFLVLKQVFDVAISRDWKVADRFRCMIDNCWWMGEITTKSSYSEAFPDSHFLCYEVRWDSGEVERLSPWDMEPIRDDRLPDNVGEPVRILPEEIFNILYHPQVEEWPQGDQITACRIFKEGIEQVMTLAIAEPFLVPVDLNQYPTYAFIVEYPIDLSTIKARLDNKFYRRVSAVQFDVRYLATNAEKFNKPHSVIVKQARIISELCLKIIEECSDSFEVGVIYHRLMDSYHSSDSEENNQPGPSTSRGKLSKQFLTRRLNTPEDWKHEARAMLDCLFECEDSEPFRQPVDNLTHPDYYQVIDTPMDLGTVREDLLGGNYTTPHDFCKDMRLIFQNSKNYNTNKRSRIYGMTTRLSSLFEDYMRKILSNWQAAKRRSNAASRKTTASAAANRRKRRATRKTNPKLSSVQTSEEEEDEPEEASVSEENEDEEKAQDSDRGDVKQNGNKDEQEMEEEVAGQEEEDDDDEEEEEEEDKEEEPTTIVNEPSTSSRLAANSETINGHDKLAEKNCRNSDSGSCSLSSPSSSSASLSSSSSSESDNHSTYRPSPPPPASSSCHSTGRGGERKNNHPNRKNGRRRRSTSYNSDFYSDDDSDVPRKKVTRSARGLRTRGGGVVRRLSSGSEELRTSSGRCVKRPKYIEDSDSEPLADLVARQQQRRQQRHSDNSSEEDNAVVTTVSSRGRVRRLTARAKALLRR